MTILLPHEFKGGAPRPTLDHRDRSFVPSFGLTHVSAPEFPDEYVTDAGIWMPNQNTYEPTFKIAAEPYGCTNYTSGDVSADLDGVLKNPEVLEAVTHANALGGYDIRASLLAAKKIGWISGFYNIQPHRLDFFDTMRLAMVSGIPEKRSISVGTPWYPDWQAAATGAVKNPDGTYTYAAGQKPRPIMPMPLSLDYAGLGWHNWKIGGWKLINGTPYMMGKIWEGNAVGDKGWVYFDRPLINAVMGLKFTIAFTATHMKPNSIYTIDMKAFDAMVSRLQLIMGFRY